MDGMQIELFICWQKLGELKEKAPQLRWNHLNNCIKKAEIREDAENVTAIQKIPKEEANKSWWKYVHCSTRKPRGGNVVSIKVPIDGGPEVREFTTKENLTRQVRKIQTYLLYSFCSGQLFDSLSLLGDIEQILEGTCVFLSDMDLATKLLLEEAAMPFSKLTSEKLKSYVMVDDFRTSIG